MKKITCTLIALAFCNLGSLAVADDPIEGFIAHQEAQIRNLEKEIAKKKDFATRAKFTEEGFKAFQAELEAMEKKLSELKGQLKETAGNTAPEKPEVNKEKSPSFDDWVKGGSKIPVGMVFPGGSPWFDESKGKRRSPEEVYKIVFPTPTVCPPAPEVVICIFPPPPFPGHWGRPPAKQTRDLVNLPAGFGKGSSTLASWIERNIKADQKKADRPKPEPKRPPVVRPPAPPRPEISKETKKELAEIEKDKADLFKAMREELGKLEKGSTKEDVRKAVVNFKKENADKFAAIKEAADKVHEELKANRPERPERPEPTAEVKEKIKAVHVAHKEIHEARKDLRADLKEATDEQKKELIKDFKASQKEKHKDLKAAHKDLREEVRATKETGDRRTSR